MTTSQWRGQKQSPSPSPPVYRSTSGGVDNLQTHFSAGNTTGGTVTPDIRASDGNQAYLMDPVVHEPLCPRFAGRGMSRPGSRMNDGPIYDDVIVPVAPVGGGSKGPSRGPGNRVDDEVDRGGQRSNPRGPPKSPGARIDYEADKGGPRPNSRGTPRGPGGRMDDEPDRGGQRNNARGAPRSPGGRMDDEADRGGHRSNAPSRGPGVRMNQPVYDENTSYNGAAAARTNSTRSSVGREGAVSRDDDDRLQTAFSSGTMFPDHGSAPVDTTNTYGGGGPNDPGGATQDPDNPNSAGGGTNPNPAAEKPKKKGFSRFCVLI